MDDIELVGRYVKEIPCEHCGGSGRCVCKRCVSSHEENMNLHYYDVDLSLMRVGDHSYSPEERAKRQQKLDKRLAECAKLNRDMADRLYGHLKDKCQTCLGSGKVNKFNNEALFSDRDQGRITSAQASAIRDRVCTLVSFIHRN